MLSLQRVQWVNVLLLLVWSTSCQGKNDSSSCVKSINEIYESEANVLDIDKLRQYTLCPNTVYRIASKFDDNDAPIDGDRPIIFGRPNVHVRCGQSGDSTNNCTLSGGLVHLGIFDEFHAGGVSAYNCEARGITFSGAQSVNVLADFHGEAAFVDCIFKDNSNRASIFVQVPEAGTLARRRRLRGFTFRGKSRSTEPGTRPQYHSLSVVVKNSQFVNNTLGVHSASAGLITKTDANLRVEHCIFANNHFVGPKKESSYLIANNRGRLILEENDFVTNRVALAPVVNQFGFVSQRSNTMRVDGELGSQVCGFIANVKEGVLGESPASETDFSCQEIEGPHS